MQILVDADGCPVIGIAVAAAKARGVDCLLFCDTAHSFEKYDVPTITVPKGADSADFVLVNRVAPGDIVITQDYGLAAMCLAKQGVVLSQDGMIYTVENIDGLLAARHYAAKIRRGGGRLKGPRKRTAQQDEVFSHTLKELLHKKML